MPPNLHIFAQWIPVLSAWRCGSLYSFMVNVFSQMVSHGAECRVQMSLRRTAVTSQAICFACFQGVPLSWLPCLLLLTEHTGHTGHTGHRHVLFSLSNVPCYHHWMPRICSAVFSVVNLSLMLLWAMVGKTGRFQTVGQRFLLAGGGRDSLAQTSAFVNRGEKGTDINGDSVPDEATLLERHRLIFGF